VQLARDYATLLSLERESWPINFPGEEFSEVEFRHSLQTGLRFHRMYVYELDDEVVGWLWLDLDGKWDGAHIRHIQVARAYWGRGIGKALVREAVSLARDEGCNSLTLNVTKSNTRAMRLYAGLGFALDSDNGDRQRMRLSLSKTGL